MRSEGLQLQRERQQEIQQRQAEANAFRAVGDDPIWSLPPDDPRLKYAVHLEGYPIELRERLIGLGQEFAMLVLGIDQGNGRSALDTLSHLLKESLRLVMNGRELHSPLAILKAFVVSPCSSAMSLVTV